MSSNIEVIAEKMKTLGLNTALPAKLPKTNTAVGTPVTVATNMRRVSVDPNVAIFKYDVNIKFFYKSKDGSREVCVEMSKSTKKGVEHRNDKERCRKVYLKAAAQNAAMKNGKFYYDSQASLYSLSKIDGCEYTFADETVSARPNFLRAEIKIVPVAESFQATTNGIKATVNAIPSQADKSLLEVLNMMVNGPAYENAEVVTIGSGNHYIAVRKNTVLPIPVRQMNTQGGKAPTVGTSNSVRTLEGSTAGQPCLFMTTEFKSTLMHPTCSLLQLLQKYRGFSKTLKANSPDAILMVRSVAGLEVHVNYGPDLEFEREPFKIRRFAGSSREQFFDCGTTKTSVFDYYKEKYNIQLSYPDLFTVEVRRHSQLIHFPVEVLYIFPDQVVTNNQMVGTEQADMITISAARPHDRKKNTEVVARHMGIIGGPNNGIVKIGNTETVQGFVLPIPVIMFANNRRAEFTKPGQRGAPTDFMQSGQYVKPMSLTNWEVVFEEGHAERGAIGQLASTMRSSGMKVEEPATSFILSQQLEPVFQKAKKAGRQLLFFITPEICNYHTEIKVLEQKYDLLTQDLRLETAAKLPAQRNTRQNIALKTNMKLGGLNYRVLGAAFDSPSRLFFGFETSKLGGSGDLPITVGFSANMMADPQNFAGGYVFTRQADGDIYGAIIKDVVTKVFMTCRANGRPKPEQLVFYFSGINEDRYNDASAVYSMEIKAACEAISGTFRPNIIIIASTKTGHNGRFYKSEGASGGVANLEPGTVIDHTIVSPNANQWYQTSAVARMGTVKAIKHTLIFTTYNERQCPPLTTLEQWTHELAFNHQIVLHPVSLPVPLYLAGANSQRGAMLVAQRRPVMKDGVVDLDATNKLLSYVDKKLFTTRFNA